jgi:hypothetical protein
MLQADGELDLALEARNPVERQRLPAHHLDHDPASQPVVPRDEDPGHAAAELALDVEVGAQGGGDDVGGGGRGAHAGHPIIP